MRSKKAPPLSPAMMEKQLTDPVPREFDVQGSIDMIERVLVHALDPTTDTTPDQLRDLAEMFITDMHLRKSMGHFWNESLPMAVDMISAAAQLTAEFHLLSVKGLSEEAQKITASARDLSIARLTSIRKRLYAKVLLLKQCPNEGDKVH